MTETVLLDGGWTLFRNGSETGEAVRLPHDAMLAEPRSADAVTGSAGAYFPGGTYRYERTLDVPGVWADKVVTLELEGVYQKATVLVDGVELARHDYGYTGFDVDLTDRLAPGAHTLTVVADNSHQPNSRWYSGSGIYRPVWLHVQPRERIAAHGVRVQTLALTPDGGARIRVTSELAGIGPDDIEVRVRILAPDGSPVAEGAGVDVALEVEGAQPWSAERPALYRYQVELVRDGQVLDATEGSFGIRTIAWGPFGLRVNGRNVLLRGGCVHHTQGILGAAEPAEAAWREVALLKAHGFNAIRSSHNPLSRTMLDACDHLGMYVMDEFADMWYRPKNPADYARDFAACWEADLAAMARKNRNHPCVILHSIGNENAEPAEARGVEVARMLADRLRELDPTRPVTAGVNPTILWAASLGIDSFNAEGEEGEGAANADGGMEGANASLLYNTYVTKMGDVMSLISRMPMVGRANAPYLDALDVAGYNYATGRYASDVRRHPDRPVLGAETMPYDLAKNWRLVEKTPQVVGDFMWTAIDYLGECSLAAWSDDTHMVNKPYPWLCADTGALDLIGDPNGEAAMAEVVWGVADPLLYVRPCTLPNPVKAPWRGTNSVPSWAWSGCEGVETTVEVYTHAPVVKLYLNGRFLAAKNPHQLHADFRVTWEPGELVALACAPDGRALGRASLSSAEGPLGLALEREPRRLPGEDGPGSVVFVDVAVADAVGVVEGSWEDEVTVAVEGGELLAFGSAAQASERSYLAGTFPLRHGRGLTIVRLGEGTCTLRAEAPGLSPATLTL